MFCIFFVFGSIFVSISSRFRSPCGCLSDQRQGAELQSSFCGILESFAGKSKNCILLKISFTKWGALRPLQACHFVVRGCFFAFLCTSKLIRNHFCEISANSRHIHFVDNPPSAVAIIFFSRHNFLVSSVHLLICRYHPLRRFLGMSLGAVFAKHHVYYIFFLNQNQPTKRYKMYTQINALTK